MAETRAAADGGPAVPVRRYRLARIVAAGSGSSGKAADARRD